MADVFAVLTDAEKTPAWSASAVVEERWLTPPPVGVGSRRLAVTRAVWADLAERRRGHRLRAGSSWTMTSVSGPRSSRRPTSLTVEQGTRVDFTWSLALTGARLIDRVPAGVRVGSSRTLPAWKSMMEGRACRHRLPDASRAAPIDHATAVRTTRRLRAISSRFPEACSRRHLAA
jgi:hypothetical protein